ncbi:MAG: sigma-70 family RNA polymerase sigma factor [Myxococcales bacterium]|nr:sigma-70 family RNA polymerase sigma factor [Myxococcales bacterium]
MENLLSNTAFLVSMGLFLVGFLAFPTLRLVAMVIAGINTSVRSIEGWMKLRSLGEAPERPLALDGLSPPLADLARQTRLLALELRRSSDAAVLWPDARADERPNNWWSAFVGVGGYEGPTDADREVWEWLRSLERLHSGERERLAGVGVDPAKIRAELVHERAPKEHIRALAGLFASLDERLQSLVGAGYRGSNAHVPASLPRSVGPRFALTSEARDGDPVGDAADAADAADAGPADEAPLRERERRWAEVLDRYGGGIARIAASHARDRGEREDLEQDIALALWQALPAFRGESSLKTFVHRVARYCCYRVLRRRGKVQLDALVDELGDPAACIESWMAQTEDRRRLERALARLPEGLESTLSRRLAGQSYAEIADALGISEQNVSVRLVRARERVSQELRAA